MKLKKKTSPKISKKEWARMLALVDSAASLKVEVDSLKNTLEDMKGTLKEFAARAKVKKIKSKNYTAAFKDGKKTEIDPELFYDEVDDIDDFISSISVKVTEAREVLSAKAIDKIAFVEVKPYNSVSFKFID